MHLATSTALAVKELEPGQFHWILLEEKPSDLDEGLVYAPETISVQYPHAGAAWVAGYLALRARMRKMG